MNSKIRTLSRISIFTALTAVCSWITIPFAVPVTLQTFAVYLACLFLGWKGAAVCVSLYIVLGAAGLPVFSAFGAGVGVLFGASGGFLTGFLFVTFVYGLTLRIFGSSFAAKLVGCVLGTAVCYLFGALWYSLAFYGTGTGGFGDILKICVLPFILPDAVKLALAVLVYKRLRRLKALD